MLQNIALTMLLGLLGGTVLTHVLLYPYLTEQPVRIEEEAAAPLNAQFIGEVVSVSGHTAVVRVVSLYPDAATELLSIGYEKAFMAGNDVDSLPKGALVTFSLARAAGPLTVTGPVMIHQR